MPHRNIIAYAASNLLELFVFGSLTIYQGWLTVLGVLRESDWSKVFGPNGVAFCSVLACIVLWASFNKAQNRARKEALEREERDRKDALEKEERDRKDATEREKREDEKRRLEDEARERRHNELVKTNKENADDLKALTAEAIKAQLIAAGESKVLSSNHQMLSINVHNLVEVIRKSPCLAVNLRDEDYKIPGFSNDSRL